MWSGKKYGICFFVIPPISFSRSGRGIKGADEGIFIFLMLLLILLSPFFIPSLPLLVHFGSNVNGFTNISVLCCCFQEWNEGSWSGFFVLFCFFFYFCFILFWLFVLFCSVFIYLFIYLLPGLKDNKVTDMTNRSPFWYQLWIMNFVFLEHWEAHDENIFYALISHLQNGNSYISPACQQYFHKKQMS